MGGRKKGGEGSGTGIENGRKNCCTNNILHAASHEQVHPLTPLLTKIPV